MAGGEAITSVIQLEHLDEDSREWEKDLGYHILEEGGRIGFQPEHHLLDLPTVPDAGLTTMTSLGLSNVTDNNMSQMYEFYQVGDFTTVYIHHGWIHFWSLFVANIPN